MPELPTPSMFGPGPQPKMPPFENPDVEKMFQLWFGGIARQQGLDPNPDSSQSLYDYRRAFLAGVSPGVNVPGARQPTIQNPDGSASSELSITVEADEINKGKPTNIPTIFGGERVSDEEAIKRIIQAGGVDPETGRELQGFNNLDEAVKAAGERSQALGNQGHFPSDFKQFGHPTLMADQGQAFMFPQTQQNQGANFFGLPSQDPLGFLMKLLQGQFK